MKPYGLVLAGGGGKGAYQVGAWKAMREIGVTFNAVAGVSIGALNGALFVQNDFSLTEALWDSISVDKGVNITAPLPDPENLFSRKNWGVLLREFMKNGGFDASPAQAFFAKYIDEDKIRKAHIPFGIVTVQRREDGMEGLELFLSDIPEGKLLDYLFASASVPLANNIGPEGERFLDGGLYDNTPVSMLRRSGFNRIVVIDIANIKGVNHNLDFQNCEVIYIRPYEIDDLGAAFDFSKETNARRMQFGYLDAKKAFSYLLGKIYYFPPAVFRGMVKKYGFRAVEQMEDLAYRLHLERLQVYDEATFLTALKAAFDAMKADENEKLRQQEERDFLTDESRLSTFLRRFVIRKNDGDFSEAIAVLDAFAAQ